MTRPVRFTFLFLAAFALPAAVGCSPSSKPSGTTPGDAAKPPSGKTEKSSPGDKQKTRKRGDLRMNMTVKSPAFADKAAIPKHFTADGEDVSPQLTWTGVPENAKTMALIVDDPDAPTPQPWVHWVIYNIPAGASGLPENVAKAATLTSPEGALQGKNSWGKIGYGGPSPPPKHGVHHYHFKLYALDAVLNVQSGLTKEELLSAMEGHILAQGELVGTYER